VAELVPYFRVARTPRTFRGWRIGFCRVFLGYLSCRGDRWVAWRLCGAWEEVLRKRTKAAKSTAPLGKLAASYYCLRFGYLAKIDRASSLALILAQEE